MKKVKTWLPVFPGFYGTMYEPDEDNEMESIRYARNENKLSEIPWDAIKFDYKAYENDVAKDCCQYFENNMKQYVNKVIFERINSPREYNFANDSIHIIVELSGENIKNIKSFLRQNKESFDSHIKKHYTGYDGFISHYSNDSSDWLTNDSLIHEHKLGQILQFIAYETIEDVDQNMLEQSTEGNYLTAINYDECTEMEYCANCKEFYKAGLRKGNVCPECYNGSIKDLDIVICAHCGETITNEAYKRSMVHKVKHGIIKVDEIFCDVCALVIA